MGSHALHDEKAAEGVKRGARQEVLGIVRCIRLWLSIVVGALIVRSAAGLLRRTRNLCLSALIEAVWDQVRAVELKQVNRVLIQPHWRNDCDQPLP